MAIRVVDNKGIADAQAELLASTQDNGVVFYCADTKNSYTVLNGNFTQYNGDFVFVYSLNDFPTPISDIITLLDGVTYFICDVVDLLGNRLVGGENTTIIGGSSENCRLKSTGLSDVTPLITSDWSLPIRNITIQHAKAISLDASLNSNQALDWFGVNFTNCSTIGTIKGYSNFVMNDSAFLNSQGLTFDGSIDTIAFGNCLFDNRNSGTSIILPSTLTVTRRFRLIYSSFISLSGETGINVSSSATIPTESYILDTVNFSGGGTYTSGVTYSDNKSLWTNCKGISNSGEFGYYYMAGNSTDTVISATSTPYKITGTTTNGAITQKFTHSNNKLVYDGIIARAFKVTVTLTLTSGNNQLIGVYVGKNGSVLSNSESRITTSGSGRSENIKNQLILELTTNDYIEVFVENYTATTNIVVTDLSVITEALN